eukprot:SAG31_NODE_5934_length_2251_cov_16.050651_1_plen_205_part_00
MRGAASSLPVLVFALCCECSYSAAALRFNPATDAVGAGVWREQGCTTAAAVAHRARRHCGETPIMDALLSTDLPSTAAETATSKLLQLGFETVLDLQLVGKSYTGGQKLQEELALQLKASGLSIGERAKIQLFVGDPNGSEGTAQAGDPDTLAMRGARRLASNHPSTAGDRDSVARRQTTTRQLQDNGASRGLSTDTVLIQISN